MANGNSDSHFSEGTGECRQRQQVPTLHLSSEVRFETRDRDIRRPLNKREENEMAKEQKSTGKRISTPHTTTRQTSEARQATSGPAVQRRGVGFFYATDPNFEDHVAREIETCLSR
jgi:hypothetical protein